MSAAISSKIRELQEQGDIFFPPRKNDRIKQSILQIPASPNGEQENTEIVSATLLKWQIPLETFYLILNKIYAGINLQQAEEKERCSPSCLGREDHRTTVPPTHLTEPWIGSHFQTACQILGFSLAFMKTFYWLDMNYLNKTYQGACVNHTDEQH